jgi:hypothetical protein
LIAPDAPPHSYTLSILFSSIFHVRLLLVGCYVPLRCRARTFNRWQCAKSPPSISQSLNRWIDNPWRWCPPTFVYHLHPLLLHVSLLLICCYVPLFHWHWRPTKVTVE